MTLFQPKYRVCHPETCLFTVSKHYQNIIKMLIGSAYPKIFNVVLKTKSLGGRRSLGPELIQYDPLIFKQAYFKTPKNVQHSNDVVFCFICLTTTIHNKKILFGRYVITPGTTSNSNTFCVWNV